MTYLQYQKKQFSLSESTDDLFIALKNESALAVKSFNENNKIVNPNKSQAMILQIRIKIAKLVY